MTNGFAGRGEVIPNGGGVGAPGIPGGGGGGGEKGEDNVEASLSGDWGGCDNLFSGNGKAVGDGASELGCDVI